MSWYWECILTMVLCMGDFVTMCYVLIFFMQTPGEHRILSQYGCGRQHKHREKIKRRLVIFSILLAALNLWYFFLA